MAAGEYPLYIEQGARFYRTFTLTHDDASIFDLTDYTARAQARKTPESDVVVASWTVGTGHLTIDEPAGEIVLDVPATETVTMDRSFGAWDLEIIPPTGEDDTERLLQGPVFLSRNTTRTTSP